jgi:hypothetical protein
MCFFASRSEQNFSQPITSQRVPVIVAQPEGSALHDTGTDLVLQVPDTNFDLSIIPSAALLIRNLFSSLVLLRLSIQRENKMGRSYTIYDGQ